MRGSPSAAPENAVIPVADSRCPAEDAELVSAVPFRSPTLQWHHPLDGPKGERRQKRSNMAAVARAARPVARAAAGRYGAALASRCARGVISHHARIELDTRRERTRARMRHASHDTRAREPPRLAGGAHPGTRLSRRAAASRTTPGPARGRGRATRAPHDPGPARAAAAAGTPHTPTHPPTRAQVALREERGEPRGCSTASRATASAPCCARRRPRRAPRP